MSRYSELYKLVKGHHGGYRIAGQAKKLASEALLPNAEHAVQEGDYKQVSKDVEVAQA